MDMTRLSRSFVWIVKLPSVHRLQLGFVNDFIAPIGFSCFTNLNVMHLRGSVRDVIALKSCSKWAENESDSYPFLEGVGDRRNGSPFFS